MGERPEEPAVLQDGDRMTSVTQCVGEQRGGGWAGKDGISPETSVALSYSGTLGREHYALCRPVCFCGHVGMGSLMLEGQGTRNTDPAIPTFTVELRV